MLLGEFEHTLDEKNRITLPARFRDSLSGGLVVTRGMDGCLYCYARSDWQSLVDSRLAVLDPLSRDDRMIQRYFFSAAVEAAPDKQGRMMLRGRSSSTRASGARSWSPECTTTWRSGIEPTWRALVKDVEGRAEDVAERLAAKHD